MPAESDVNPFLQQNFRPWGAEGERAGLPVRGEIPRDLHGTFYRNGPNPAFEPLGRYHWFDGDGMIHAIRFEDGRAAYRNRWVASDGLRAERAAGRALYPGLLDFGAAAEGPGFKNTANTNIVSHAGKLLALMEAALPTELVPCTLATVGEYDFAGRLAGPMTAHPKIDPETGELLFFGYSPMPPYLQYHVADRTGRLVQTEPIEVAWPSMMHDFAITRDEVIFILCPLVFSLEDLARRGGPFTWEPERGTRLGVMARRGDDRTVRWYETDPCYVFHPMNAYREGDTIVLDVARYPRLDFMTPRAAREELYADDNTACLHRWRIDLAGATVRSQPLDDVHAEFPRVDAARLGRRHRFGYMAATGPETATRMPLFTAVRKYDLDTGRIQERRFGAANGVGEPLFVRRATAAAEDDGYVLVLAYDHVRDTSECLVLDARDIAGEPLARVELPNRIPYGFHGNWVAAA